MVRIGCISLNYFSHMQAMVCIATELHLRGHHITFFGTPDTLKTIADKSEFDKVELGADVRPLGREVELAAKQATLSGMAGVNHVVNNIEEMGRIFCEHGPSAICEAHIDVLITDQAFAHARLLARHLQLPFIEICNAIIILDDPNTPHCATTYRFSDSYHARARNRLINALFRLMSWRIIASIREYSDKWGMHNYTSLWQSEILSPYAVLSQGLPPPLFDYRTLHPIPQLHYIGRWTLRNGEDGLARDVPMPKIDCTKRIVYASFGTMQTEQIGLYLHILKACAALENVQLILSTGIQRRRLPEEMQEEISRKEKDCGFIVTDYAPQSKVIPNASAVVTHGGLNTVVMCLANGVPMVVIPISTDQPAVSSRVIDCGAGVRINKDAVTETKLSNLLLKVLDDPQYKLSAEKLKPKFKEAGGVVKAADIVEKVVETKASVRSDSI